MSPAFSINGTELDTEDAPGGRRILVTATVENNGAVAGEYDMAMTLDGGTVNETTVTVPAGETRTVTLSAVTDSAGAYDVGVNDQAVGIADIGQIQTATPGAPTATPTATTATTATATATPTSQPAGGGSGDAGGGSGPAAGDGLLPSSLPETVAGVPTVLVVGVSAGVLVFLLIGGLLWRSGRSGGGSDPNRW
jgi:hypothetical protein